MYNYFIPSVCRKNSRLDVSNLELSGILNILKSLDEPSIKECYYYDVNNRSKKLDLNKTTAGDLFRSSAVSLKCILEGKSKEIDSISLSIAEKKLVIRSESPALREKIKLKFNIYSQNLV